MFNGLIPGLSVSPRNILPLKGTLHFCFLCESKKWRRSLGFQCFLQLCGGSKAVLSPSVVRHDRVMGLESCWTSSRHCPAHLFSFPILSSAGMLDVQLSCPKHVTLCPLFRLSSLFPNRVRISLSYWWHYISLRSCLEQGWNTYLAAVCWLGQQYENLIRKPYYLSTVKVSKLNL